MKIILVFTIIISIIIYKVLYKKNNKLYNYDIIIEPGGNYGFLYIGYLSFY